jgi:hypothetical protein
MSLLAAAVSGICETSATRSIAPKTPSIIQPDGIEAVAVDAADSTSTARKRDQAAE